MTLAMQHDLFGGSEWTGDVIQKVRHLLQNDSGCRDSYAELVGVYWLEFDGLANVIPPECHEAFIRWLNNEATSWKTIQNRAEELQHRQPELDASAGIRARRERQATQGVVR